MSGIIFININWLSWYCPPAEYGPPKTPYNRWKCWSDTGVFAQIMVGQAEQAPVNKTIPIDATYLKANRTASSLWLEKRGRGRLFGQTKGGMNTKLLAMTDKSGRPIRLFITPSQVSDYTRAAALMNGLPAAEWLLGDRGYDADWYRNSLIDKGTEPCIPGRKSRKKTRQIREAPGQEAHSHRKIVRQAQVLAARRNPLRQITNRFPLHNHSRGNRYLLVMLPDPRPLARYARVVDERSLHDAAKAVGLAPLQIS
ncbi:IS5 family transposase [Octadecabacter sp. G9-8]|uniref:IS5 family transposase n=1 Tax=Octadecabacter dasysiphoniae TaxID=2909341 RepID=A0ABS9CR92_9RHOB|nr:IS5 family transposase [Octadecabacter dasysiphoniae]MCF2869456.1 IS5 family transposase [Octadecabacter dasysiphoniae]